MGDPSNPKGDLDPEREPDSEPGGPPTPKPTDRPRKRSFKQTLVLGRQQPTEPPESQASPSEEASFGLAKTEPPPAPAPSPEKDEKPWGDTFRRPSRGRDEVVVMPSASRGRAAPKPPSSLATTEAPPETPAAGPRVREGRVGTIMQGTGQVGDPLLTDAPTPIATLEPLPPSTPPDAGPPRGPQVGPAPAPPPLAKGSDPEELRSSGRPPGSDRPASPKPVFGQRRSGRPARYRQAPRRAPAPLGAVEAPPPTIDTGDTRRWLLMFGVAALIGGGAGYLAWRVRQPNPPPDQNAARTSESAAADPAQQPADPPPTDTTPAAAGPGPGPSPSPGVRSQAPGAAGRSVPPLPDRQIARDLRVRARSLMLRREYRRAEPLWRLALEKDPVSATGAAGLAKTLRGLGRHQDALIWARRAISISEVEPRHHELLGDVLVDLGKVEAAKDAYRMAIQRGKNEPTLVERIEKTLASLR